MACPEEVRLGPGKFLPSAIALCASRRCASGSMVCQESEVVSAPLDGAETIVGEVWDLEIISQPPRARHSRGCECAILVITWQTEHHLVLYRRQLADGGNQLLFRRHRRMAHL